MSLFRKNFLVQTLKFTVAFGLIALLIYSGKLDFGLLKTLLTPFYLTVLFLMAGMNTLLLNYRWQLLLRERSLPWDFKRVFPTYLIGIFFNYALPGAIGGDVVKAFYVARDNPSRKMDAISTVLVDRILGLYSMVLISLVVVVLNYQFVVSQPELVWAGLMILGLFGFMSLFFGVAFSRRLRRWVNFDLFLEKMPLGEKLKKVYLAFHAYRDHTPVLAQSVLISVLAQTVAIFFMIVVGNAIGEGHIAWETYFFAAPLGFIISAVPLAPAGIGVGQMAFLFLFQLYSGQETPLGQTAITAFQIALFAWGLVGAFFYLRRKKPELEEVTS